MTSTRVSVTTPQEVKDYVTGLGLRAEFDEILTKIPEIVPELLRIECEFDPGVEDESDPLVGIWVALPDHGPGYPTPHSAFRNGKSLVFQVRFSNIFPFSSGTRQSRMRGREFLDTANRLSAMTAEPDWRSAMSRAYYALLLECRDALNRWGFSIPPRASHRDVYHYLQFPRNADSNQIARTFQNLSGKRNRADYDLSPHTMFTKSTDAIAVIKDARDAVALLDAIEADATRKAQAIADIRAVFP